jgi:hypothetical protein
VLLMDRAELIARLVAMGKLPAGATGEKSAEVRVCLARRNQFTAAAWQSLLDGRLRLEGTCIVVPRALYESSLR